MRDCALIIAPARPHPAPVPTAAMMRGNVREVVAPVGIAGVPRLRVPSPNARYCY
jgi:hypothetical protein